MKSVFFTTFRFFTVGAHFLVLLLSIIKTFIKRGYLKIRKIEIKHPHLQTFIDKRRESGCNLNSLFESLEEQSNNQVIIATIVKLQETYSSKDELINSLPSMKPDTEIIAIPIALTAFSFFRHFVTIIIDNREGIIEFYDPIGFSTSQYKHSYLWGPKCEKGSHLMLFELMKSIKKKYNISTVIENKKIHQTDFNQCALFVYDRIYKRGSLGFSFEKASKSPMSSKQAFI